MISFIERTPRIQDISIKELVDLSHQTDQGHRAWDTQAGELIWPGRPDERDWLKAAVPTCTQDWYMVMIVKSSETYVQAIQGLLAFLRGTSTAKPRHRIVDRKALHLLKNFYEQEKKKSLLISRPSPFATPTEPLFFFLCEIGTTKTGRPTGRPRRDRIVLPLPMPFLHTLHAHNQKGSI